MEENVALDSSKQKKFDKSIKGIKKLIKKTGVESKSKSNEDKVKSGKIGKKKRKERGLVYLGHIPHGFYEHEMTEYFKQFGVVTNVRVIKSKRTGRSKGFAFVEFKEPMVAQIVAETMNNYLMGKRLIKASYIPPEKQKRKALRKHWNSVNNPGNNMRLKMKKAHNENRDEAGELQRAKKYFSNINNTKKKLLELGINYDFFLPVDVPEVLQGKVQSKEEDSNIKTADTISKTKGKNSVIKNAEENKDVRKETRTSPGSSVQVKNKSSQKSMKNVKQAKADLKTQDKNQKQKKEKFKDSGVIPLEEFIQIKQDTDSESGSSAEFDSDEFEKSLLSDDEVEIDTDIDESDEASNSEQEDKLEIPSSDEREEFPKSKKKMQKSVAQTQKVEKHTMQKKQQPQKQIKRLATKPIAAFKKPKYEKNSSQNPKNKQFKKKK